MRNIYELLREKEAQIAVLQKEVEALRIAARLLADDDRSGSDPIPAMPTRPVSRLEPSSIPAPTPLAVVPSPHAETVQVTSIKDAPQGLPTTLRQFP